MLQYSWVFLSPTKAAQNHRFAHLYKLLIKLLCHQIKILLPLLMLRQWFIVQLWFVVSYLTLNMLTAHIYVSSAKKLCMVYHDTDDITYQNHCYTCNRKFFGPIRTTPPEQDSAVAHYIMQLSANPTSDVPIVPQISTSLPDSISRLSMHSSGTSTPVF